MGSDGGGGRGGWETGGYGGFQVHLSEQLPAFGVLHHNPPIIVKAVELALVCAWRGVEAALGGHGGELVVEVQPALLRHKGDRHLACEKGVEVKAVKELLLLEGLNVLEAAVFAAVQQAAAQRPRRGGHAVRELQGLRLDKLVHLIQVLAVEGRQTADHLVQKDAQRPPVHRLSVASRRVQELGSQVLGGAAEGGGLLLAVDARLRKAEVGDAAVALPVEHAVLRLQVPVDDVQRVQVPQRQPDLRRVELRPALRERPHLRQVVEQLAAGQEVEDEEQRLLRLERKVQLHNVRVVDRPQDVLLRLHVLHEPLPQDQLLRHALHRVDLLRVLLPHLHHLAERPLAHHRQQVEVLQANLLCVEDVILVVGVAALDGNVAVAAVRLRLLDLRNPQPLLLLVRSVQRVRLVHLRPLDRPRQTLLRVLGQRGVTQVDLAQRLVALRRRACLVVVEHLAAQLEPAVLVTLHHAAACLLEKARALRCISHFFCWGKGGKGRGVKAVGVSMKYRYCS
eukprot:Rhum_TRINITY_DN14643_c10_g1::Rhum_TRINITY_DN14643_c10_g1_i3::g.107438::m.107438